MTQKNIPTSKRSFLLVSLLCCLANASWSEEAPSPSVITDVTPPVVTASGREIRAIHLTAVASGSKRYREKLDRMFQETVINAVVVDLKDEGGEVYVPGVKIAERIGSYRKDIRDLGEWVAELKKQNIYVIGRIVTFKDNHLPRKMPETAVRNPQGELWRDRKHITWIDPYNREGWKYIHLISLEAAKIGFDEIQYDYIRFPTDGALAQMRFSKPYSRTAASEALVQFLREAGQLLHPLGTKISIDVFGLTTSDDSGMGIGQVLRPMAEQVDFVCPMTYPSHYAKMEYGIPNPNDAPYRTISKAMRDAIKSLGMESAHKIRPYLQDFSLKGRGIPYHAKEVRAQIQAAADSGIMSWTLWNASCRYTWEAIQTPVTPTPSSTTETTPK